MTTLTDILAERKALGDPFDVILNDNTSTAGKPLHRVIYNGGVWEYLPSEKVNQCSANAGGDPASGCDRYINPYVRDGLCASHRVERAITELLA